MDTAHDPYIPNQNIIYHAGFLNMRHWSSNNQRATLIYLGQILS